VEFFPERAVAIFVPIRLFFHPDYFFQTPRKVA
jgi:hypothetical protein